MSQGLGCPKFWVLSRFWGTRVSQGLGHTGSRVYVCPGVLSLASRVSGLRAKGLGLQGLGVQVGVSLSLSGDYA